MYLRKYAALTLCALALGGPAHADEVSDALAAALAAYQSGDIATTSQQMVMAEQALGRIQADKLTAFLPQAPEGWTRTDSPDFAAAFGMAGGGTGAEAQYTNADGSQSVTISYIADSPMVASMGAMLASPQMMAMMGKVVKVGDQALLSQDGSLSALVGNRVLFQGSGSEAEMMALVEAIDFAKLAAFDAQ